MAAASITKVFKSINDFSDGLQKTTITSMKEFLVAKLTEEYDSEFVEAVSKLIDEFSTDLPKSSAIVGKNVLKKEKKTRAPTAYNIFLKETMAEMKSVGTELKGKALMMAAVE
jgi:hypothetical protein